MLVQIGSIVRSYDFPGNYGHYAVGEVIAMFGAKTSPMGYPCYQIAVTERVSGDVFTKRNDIVFAPLNGTPGVFGPCEGVVVVGLPK